MGHETSSEAAPPKREEAMGGLTRRMVLSRLQYMTQAEECQTNRNTLNAAAAFLWADEDKVAAPEAALSAEVQRLHVRIAELEQEIEDIEASFDETEQQARHYADVLIHEARQETLAAREKARRAEDAAYYERLRSFEGR